MMMNTLNKFLLSRSMLMGAPVTRVMLKQPLQVNSMTYLSTRGFYYPDANHHHLNQEVS